MSHPISLVIARAAKLKGQRVAADRLDHLEDQLQELASSDPIEQFTFAWKLAELDGEPARLSDPVPADMPFLALKDGAWFFLLIRHWARIVGARFQQMMHELTS